VRTLLLINAHALVIEFLVYLSCPLLSPESSPESSPRSSPQSRVQVLHWPQKLPAIYIHTHATARDTTEQKRKKES